MNNEFPPTPVVPDSQLSEMLPKMEIKRGGLLKSWRNLGAVKIPKGFAQIDSIVGPWSFVEAGRRLREFLKR